MLVTNIFLGKNIIFGEKKIVEMASISAIRSKGANLQWSKGTGNQDGDIKSIHITKIFRNCIYI